MPPPFKLPIAVADPYCSSYTVYFSLVVTYMVMAIIKSIICTINYSDYYIATVCVRHHSYTLC